MKKIWFAFWAELILIFRSPREVHRVIAAAPIAVLSSHAFYMFFSMPSKPFTSAEWTAITLGGFLYAMSILWCFLSNEMTVHLFNRFAIVSALTVLYHQVFFYSVGLGDTYPKILSTIAYALLMIWAITGKNYRDFIKDHVQPKVNAISKLFIQNEKKDDVSNEKKGNVVGIHDSKSAINE